MTASAPRTSFWSERVWPVVRVVLLQLLLATGIVGNLVGWLVLALLVDRLHWLHIDFHGKTLDTIAPDGRVLGFCLLLAVNLLLVLAAWWTLERKPLRALLWRFTRDQWRPLVWGLLAGAGEVALVFALMTACGLARSRWGLAAVPFGTLVLALGWLLASSILGPLAEEILHRGYWLQNLARGWGMPAAAVVTALLFGGLHLFNPHAEILGAVNIALSGLTYVLGLLWLRSLWFPIGWHAAWNFAQFFVVGLPNSGITVGSLGLDGTTLLATTVSGPRWLTGGEFGMEASLVETVVLVGILAGMGWLKTRRPRPADDTA
jgi:membrane protease YdiL (CAAX protease family)